MKGVALPADYKEQVDRFFGPVVRGPALRHDRDGAGDAALRGESATTCAPGLIMLMLDQRRRTADRAPVGTAGVVEGRFGFLDLLYEGRWGGLITGDKVTVDFAERCPCGRHGPTLLDNIARFAQVPAETTTSAARAPSTATSAEPWHDEFLPNHDVKKFWRGAMT